MSVKSWFDEENLIRLSDDLLKNRDQKIFNFIDFEAAQKFQKKDHKHWNLLQLALWAHNNQNVL